MFIYYHKLVLVSLLTLSGCASILRPVTECAIQAGVDVIEKRVRDALDGEAWKPALDRLVAEYGQRVIDCILRQIANSITALSEPTKQQTHAQEYLRQREPCKT